MNADRPSLYERTRELLRTRPRGVTLHDVAKGSGLRFTFIHAVSRGENTEPGVNKVQALYEYLSGKPLEY